MFNGNGYTISGLYYNDASVSNVGLFAQFIGTLKNVRVVDSYFRGGNFVGLLVGNCTNQSSLIDCYAQGVAVGSQYVGGVAGRGNGGEISNCDSESIVVGSSNVGGVVGAGLGNVISNSYNIGTIRGIENVGGISGYNTANITNCYNTGDVIATGEKIGGIVGCINDDMTISNSYNQGDISGSQRMGGIAGYSYNNEITIDTCYNTGSITSTLRNAEVNIGGIIGVVRPSGTIANCYNTGKLDNVAGYNVGGIAGNMPNGTIKNCFNIGEINNTTVYSDALVKNSEATITNCYFLVASPTQKYGIQKSAERFASGEVAYLLSIGQIADNVTSTSLFGQNIDNGEEKSDYPVLGGARVYGVATNCANYVLSNYEDNLSTITPGSEHSVGVKAEGNVLYEYCAREGCSQFSGGKYEMQDVPTGFMNYTKQPIVPSLELKAEFTTFSATLVKTEYYVLSKDGYVKMDTLPTNVGSYRAEATFTVNDTEYKIFDEYSINGQSLVNTAVATLEVTSGEYNGQQHTIVLTDVKDTFAGVAQTDITAIYLEEGVDYIVKYFRDGEETTDLTSAGEIIIKLEGINNFGGTKQVAVYTITKKLLTIRAEDKTIEQYTELPNFTYTVIGLIDGDNFTVDPSLTSDVANSTTYGQYTITASGAENDNYEIQYIQGTLVITQHIEHRGEEATCMQKATCDVCSEEYGTVSEHNFADATCTTPKICIYGCGTIEGLAQGHSFTEYESDNNATCTTDGTKTAGCDNCDETDTKTDDGTALGHIYGMYDKTDAEHWKHCVRDGCNYIDETTRESHTYGEWTVTKEATETETGENGRFCLACSYKQTETIPVIENGLSGGAIAGIVIGSVAVVGVAGFVVFWFAIKKKKWSDLIAIFKKK